MTSSISEIKIRYTNKTPARKRISVTTSQQAASVLKSSWDIDLIEAQEEFKVLLLNNANQVLGIQSLSKGSATGTVVDGKIMFSVALKAFATKIIMCHNHPSGNLTPSAADIDMTAKYKSAARLLDIQLIDHIILTKESYYSFADIGEM